MQLFLPNDYNQIKRAAATDVTSVCTGQQPAHFIASIMRLMATFPAKTPLDRKNGSDNFLLLTA
jgi:hypothetical protein